MGNKRVNKDCIISVRCSEEEKIKLKLLAEKADKKESEYILSRCIPAEQRKQKIRKCEQKVLICQRKRQEDLNKIRRVVDRYKDDAASNLIVGELTVILDGLEDELYAETENTRKNS